MITSLYLCLFYNYCSVGIILSSLCLLLLMSFGSVFINANMIDYYYYYWNCHCCCYCWDWHSSCLLSSLFSLSTHFNHPNRLYPLIHANLSSSTLILMPISLSIYFALIFMYLSFNISISLSISIVIAIFFCSTSWRVFHYLVNFIIYSRWFLNENDFIFI